MDKFKEIRSIIVLDGDVAKFVVDLAFEIANGALTLIRIDGSKYFPHITLYNAEYPIGNIQKVALVTNQIAKGTLSFDLDFDNFSVGFGYVGLGFKKNKMITKLHARVVEELCPLREGRLREKYDREIRSRKYPPEQVEYIKEFGYHNIFKAFEPHLTLARFEDPDVAEKIATGLNSHKMIFKVKVGFIGLAEVGSHGTCTKIVQKFSLANSYGK